MPSMMKPKRSSLLAALFTLSALFAGSTSACSAEPFAIERRAPRELARAFPAHASAVTDLGDGFAPTSSGFSGRASEALGGFSQIVVELPQRSDDRLRLRTRGGFEVSVRELAENSQGVLVNRSIMYPRDGVTSYWTVGPDKAEEWLHFAAPPRGVALAWDVQGGSLEQRDGSVAILDRSGVARLWVSAPAAYAASGAAVRAVLTPRGSSIELSLEGDAGESLVDPVWSAAPPMSAPRSGHAATPLPKGRVLVSGGSNGPSFAALAEIYEPQSNTWLAGPLLTTGRARHTATALDNGDVLIAGGSSGVDEQSVERFSAAAYSFAAASPMAQPRSRHTATKLIDGSVLVVGGESGGSPLASSELYDESTGAWSPVGGLTVARRGHATARLSDGRVLVVGGENAGGALSSVEVYDPSVKTWTSKSPMKSARRGAAAILLSDGRVFVAGGYNGASVESSAEIYEPGADAWIPAASMLEAREDHAAAGLANGHVLITGGSAGGAALSSAEVYDPATDTSRSVGSMGQARTRHSAISLPDGDVLITGGASGGVDLATAEIYQPLSVGASCAAASDCLSGFCVDSVCCNEACDNGACDACSASAGAQKDGICMPFDGVPCDDNDLCTQGDLCQAGACVGGAPIICPLVEVCRVGVCEPSTGACVPMDVLDGQKCQTNNACVTDQECKAGVCVGEPVECYAFDICHNPGTCNPMSGKCKGTRSETCAVPGKPEPPPHMPANVRTCVEAAGCESGFCVSGVCCDSACTGLCNSCIVPGSEGICTREPRGMDIHNHCGSATLCLKTCSGEETPTCVDAEEGSQCAPNQCADDGYHGAFPAYCTAKGAVCPTAERYPFNCTPYKCMGLTGVCGSSCKTSTDCNSPFVCDPDGKCVPTPAVTSGHSTACAARPGGAPGSEGAVVLGAALIVAARASRRRRGGPSRPSSPRNGRRYGINNNRIGGDFL